MAEEAASRKKSVYVGAPACFALDLACADLNRAFDGQCFLVGSALERPNWRDVDVRLMLDDDKFARLFPAAGANWEFDPRWLVMVVSISAYLAKLTGLPVDFQFQPVSHANKRHSGPRNPLGIRRQLDPSED